ncbi:ABC transporter substrate-binding protein [Inquilinus sp. Marseille-Q2685]|uniref:ABC transporter substrate-binding protein n=1 Tax=Inquilinus sp. Marseille-Q2685 TaxID=2866581 RepID=UPI001CE3C41C|nr:ABC transporter substrate-binding protein [Inquilinus sp. Marseille-Q2685]
MRRPAVIPLLLVLGLAAMPAMARPHRVVSLNLCADALVLRLADRADVQSVTWLARDPENSVVAAEAASVPVNRGLAEEVAALDPDLVVVGAFTPRGTVALLRRLGMPLLELGVPESLDGIRAQIRQMAAALGQAERGEQMIAAMDGRLAAVRSPASPPLAVVLRPNGFTAGRSSLVDEILRRAGVRNLAAERGLEAYGEIPLETVALAGVRLLILNQPENGAPSLGEAMLDHPILAALPGLRVVRVPSRLWTCGGPEVAEAAALIADAAREATGEGR